MNDKRRDEVDLTPFVPGTTGYRRISLALFVAGLATFTLLYSTQALLPELASSFNVSEATSTWSVSAATLGLGLGLLIAGPASDQFGRTSFIRASILASTVVAVACTLAPSWSAFVTLRLVEGALLSGLPAVATAYLREELDPSFLGRAAGVYIGGTAIGGMAGRVMTGLLTDLAGWRFALLATAVLGLVCAVTVVVVLPASRFFVPTAAGARSALASTVQALSEPPLLALYAIGACSVGSLVAVFNTLGFRLVAPPFGLGVGSASLIFSVYLLGTGSSVIFGRLADRFGRAAVMPIGVVASSCGIAITFAENLIPIIIGVSLLVIGFFAVHGIASSWVPTHAHSQGIAAGQAASLYLFSYYVGSSAFGTVSGIAWQIWAWNGVGLLSLVLFGAVGVLAWILKRTQP